MKILVCGGRTFTDYNFLSKVLYEIKNTSNISTIIHGGASGADTLAGMWAKANGIYIEKYLANWKKYGKAAGYIRNKTMLDVGKPDLVIAFPGGKGTKMMVQLSKNTDVRIIDYN